MHVQWEGGSEMRLVLSEMRRWRSLARLYLAQPSWDLHNKGLAAYALFFTSTISLESLGGWELYSSKSIGRRSRSSRIH